MFGVGEFGLEVRQVRAARARAGGIARLRHEARDHAMEDDAVIEALTRQLLDARHMIGGDIGLERNDDRPRLQLHDNRVFGIGRHYHFLFVRHSV